MGAISQAKGVTQFGNNAGMAGPEQIMRLGDELARLDGESVETLADLPPVESVSLNGVANWPGRTVYVIAEGASFIWNGTRWAADGARQRVWEFKRSGNQTELFPAGSFASLISGTIENAPAGDYLVTATAVVESSSLQVGYFRVMAAGVNLFDDMRCDPRGGSPTPVSSTGARLNFSGGSFAVDVLVQVAGDTGRVYRNGTAIRVAYLGRR